MCLFYLLLLKRNSWNTTTKRFQTFNHSVVSWSLEDKPSPLTDAHFSANLWTSHNTTTHRPSADTFHKLRITYRLYGLYGPVAVWMTGASVKLRVGFVVYSGPQHSMLHFTLCISTIKQLGNLILGHNEPQSAIFTLTESVGVRCEGWHAERRLWLA